MDSAIASTLTQYCYLVTRGKPAASLALQDRYIHEANTIIDEYGLSSYTETLSEGWVTLWVYKYGHILDVIQATPQVPKTSFDHWVLGKLYGYDETSIQEFLMSKHS